MAPSPSAKQIGSQLKARRRIVFPGDTQRDMALRLGVGEATYGRMERGDARVSFRHYLDAAEVLGCLEHAAALFSKPDREKGLLDRLLQKTEGET